MSLNWNVSKVANHDTVCFTQPDEDGNREMRSLTNTLIWATIAVDLGSIKATNIDEWLFRLQGLAIAYGDSGWADITRAELQAHIGLSTNVVDTTRAKFVTKIAKAIEREAADKVAVKRAEELAAEREAASA